jgi:hypothetical protein
VTQVPKTLELRDSLDIARAHIIEAILNRRGSILPDLHTVSVAFLQRGDYMDAGLIIRGLALSASKCAGTTFVHHALTLSMLGDVTELSNPLVALRLKTLRKWIRTAIREPLDDRSRVLIALLDADELLSLRALNADATIHRAWSDWALRTALDAQGSRCSLLCENAAELAAPAALRTHAALRLAFQLVSPGVNSSLHVARFVRQLLVSVARNDSIS